jgi:hypothetical protein
MLASSLLHCCDPSALQGIVNIVFWLATGKRKSESSLERRVKVG